MLFVWPSMDISSFLCVQPFPDPSSTSSLLSLHYLVTFYLFLLPVHLFSFYHSLALSSYPLLSHYVIRLSFSFLLLSRFYPLCFSVFHHSIFLLLFLCCFFTSLSLSQKISSPHLHLWVFVLGVEFSSSLCVFSLGCTYRYSVQFGSYKLNMLWISEPARNRHRKRKSIIS